MLSANLTYFRLRRELFDEFNRLLGAYEAGAHINIPEDVFIVIRYFLTSRNESIDDNKRLSFDKAIFQLRNSAVRALNPIAVGTLLGE